MIEAQVVCPRCAGPTAGWKCAICGSEADEHDVNHLHSGSDRYCTLLCRGCGEADVHCACAPETRGVGADIHA